MGVRQEKNQFIGTQYCDDMRADGKNTLQGFNTYNPILYVELHYGEKKAQSSQVKVMFICFDMSTLRNIAKRKYAGSHSQELLVYLEFNSYTWGFNSDVLL